MNIIIKILYIVAVIYLPNHVSVEIEVKLLPLDDFIDSYCLPRDQETLSSRLPINGSKKYISGKIRLDTKETIKTIAEQDLLAEIEKLPLVLVIDFMKISNNRDTKNKCILPMRWQDLRFKDKTDHVAFFLLLSLLIELSELGYTTPFLTQWLFSKGRRTAQDEKGVVSLTFNRHALLKKI